MVLMITTVSSYVLIKRALTTCVHIFMTPYWPVVVFYFKEFMT